uniref:uncharacterized protein isoform X2 n=1 Tax=Semicossyphus pulcher TaxID=241346 RepID=UPI0037E758AA
MDRCKLFFVLLLMQTFYVDNKAATENLEKTIGSEPDFTPICTNSTLNIITLIICKIHTEMSHREECRLMYRLGHDFEHECDSRFRLVRENQTVFLHLTGLTPEDSGTYSCECSTPDGTNKLHLNITVEGDEDTSSITEMPFMFLVTGVVTFSIITGVILGFIHRAIRHGRLHELPTNLPVTEHVEDIEPYDIFLQRENGLYSLLRLPSRKANMINSPRMA